MTTALSARWAFVLPGPTPGTPNLQIFGADPLALISQVPTLPGAYKVLVNPTGTRAYVIARAGGIQVLNLANQFQEITRYSLGATITEATLTPDGRKLLIVAGELAIIDLTNDLPGSIPRIAAGNQPNDVAVSADSRYAYVVSAVSRILTVVDLTSNSTAATQSFTQNLNGVSVSPNGLVYVSATGRLYELDYRGGIQFVQPNGFSFDADPGRASFSPSGSIAVMLNQATGGIGVIAVDLKARTVTTASTTAPAPLTNLIVSSETNAFCIGNERLLAFGIGPASIPTPASLGIPDGLTGLALSDESPLPRSLYSTLGSQIYRVTLGGTTGASSINILGTVSGVSFGSASSTNPVATIRNVASSLAVAPGGTTLPLAVRLSDSDGRPVIGATVGYSSPATGVQFSATSTTSNSAGLASIRATMPAQVGNYVIRAQSANGNVAEIPIQVVPNAQVGQTRLTIVSGNGQVITGGALSQPFRVLLQDSLGAPVVGATISWQISFGVGAVIAGATTATDAIGGAQAFLQTTAFTPSITDAVRPVTITASVNTPSFNGTVDLYGVIYPSALPQPAVQFSSTLGGSSGTLLLPAGALLNNAFRAVINSSDPALPVPVPNFGIRAYLDQTNNGPTASCQNNPVSNASGVVVCNLLVGNNLGNGTMTVILGESSQFVYSYPVRVVPGVPARLAKIQGDGQTGTPGATTPRALVVEVQDSQGNTLPGISATWTIVSGDGTIVGPVNVSDRDGRISALVRFGSAAGPIQVRVATEGLSEIFILQNNAPIGAFTLVSGSNQSTPIDQSFGQPLVVALTKADGTPFAGATIQFAVTSGPVSLSGASATTDSLGQASITARGNSLDGPAIVTATFGTNSVTFNLTVTPALPAGPAITAILNGASFAPGLSACAIGTLQGTTFLPLNPTGPLTAPLLGPLPTTLGGTSLTVGGITAPLFSVSSTQINFQVPCEVANGASSLTLTVGSQSVSANVTILETAPGVFEFTNSLGNRQAVVVKANGTYATPQNPVAHGETVTAYFTGLPATSTTRFTNQPGNGQVLDASRVVIGVNNQGMPVVAVRYAPNLIGVYTVQFTIDPAVAGVGNAQAFALAASTQAQQLVYSQGTTIPVRAAQ
ncbi:MAG: hypothetical protein NTV70_18965 [Acidobacteria bacterium]|nr:hypothetical protein [Acidobacteriota bacterium]